jgi:putative ABC transport system permease protein
MQNLLQDLRYAVRMLLKRPGFTVVAVVTLALGIGANTAIFSVVNGVLLQPLPFDNPAELAMVWENHQGRGGPDREWLSPADFEDWRAQNTSFSHLSAINNWGPTLTGLAEPEPLVGAAVSHDLFTLLGREPVLGRSFRPEEDKAGAPRVVVLSNELWQRRFGSDREIVGKSISLNQENFTVVGVMPAGFKFPVIANTELWCPLRPIINPSCQRGCVTLRVIARMKRGVSLATAAADLNAIAQRLESEYPETNTKVGATVVPLHEQLVGNMRRPLLVLLAAVGFVLLIACVNVANLMLSRSRTRQREIAIRAALGASRRRVIRQMLTESSLLVTIGGALGLLLAVWLLRIFSGLAPVGAPRFDEIRIDATVLGFTLGAAILTGLIFGLLPALGVSRLDLNRSLKEGKGTPDGHHSGRLRGALVIAEMALALMLLIGGGLLMKSFLLLQRVDPGFNPNQVLTLRLFLNRTQYPEGQQIRGFYASLLDRLKTLPGAQGVAAISNLPLAGNNTDTSFLIEGQPVPPAGRGPVAWYNSVSPNYFSTMEMGVVKGRVFTDHDDEKSPRVVIISETMARRYWPGQEPLGQRIGSGPDNWREIVGVVKDVKHFGLDADTPPSMYFPFRQTPTRGMTLVVRTVGSPLGVVPALRRDIWTADRNLAITQVLTMNELVSSSITQQRFIVLLLGCFAALALVLAAVGIYGVMSYSVTQRTHEIGIRVALGARNTNVLALVLKSGMMLAAIGAAIGVLGALALTRLMSTLLFGVTPKDAPTFIGLSLGLLAVALIACYLPARRATKVDPLVALRYE